LTSAEAYAAKLKQKEAKDKLEGEKQVCLQNRNNKNKHNKENAKKPLSSKRNSNVLPKTPLPVCTVKFSTVSPLLSGFSVKYVSSGLELGKEETFVCNSCK